MRKYCNLLGTTSAHKDDIIERISHEMPVQYRERSWSTHFLRPTLSSKFRFFQGCKVDNSLPKLLSDGHSRLFVRKPDVLPSPHASPQPLLDSIDDPPKSAL